LHILESALQEEAVLLASDLTVRAANRYFLAANNLSAADIEKRPCHEVLKSCSVFCKQATGECPMHEALATGAKVSVTLEDVATANGTRHFAVDIYPAPSQEEGDRLLLHVTRDITARVNEERLKEEMWREILLRMEQLYGAMVQSHRQIEGMGRELDQLTDLLPLAMIWWDQQGEITRVNPSTEVLLGWNQQELAGRHLSTIFASGAAQSRCRQAITATLLGQTMGYSLTENRSSSGALITCEWFHTPLTEADGTISGGLSLGQDVSARFTAERKLHDAEQKNAALLQASFDAVLVVNSLGRIVEWNRTAESLFGWREAEIVGREAEMLFPLEQQTEQRDFLRQFLAGRSQKIDAGRQIRELQAMRRDGSVFPVALLLIRTAIEQSPAAIGVFHDLSEQRHIKTLLARSEKLKEIGQLAEGLAHRFNDRITTQLATADLLLERIDNKELLRHLQHLRDHAEADRQAVHNLLLHAGAEVSAAEEHDIRQLVDEAVQLTGFRWADAAAKGAINMVTRHEPSLPKISVREADFREMIMALLFNAVDCLAGEGTVTVTTGRQEGGALIQIEDNGPGIARENLPHIFEPFFTTKGSSHAGMGLTLARNIARQHGGELTVDSTVGLGSRFTIWLPFERQEEAGEKRTGRNEGERRILVVEADASMRSLLEETLRRKGRQLTSLDDGRRAILFCHDTPVDLIVCGEDCGGMSGRELIWRLKHRSPETPALLLVAADDAETRLKAMAEGADLVLAKPFSTEELLGAIRQLPGMTGNSKPSRQK